MRYLSVLLMISALVMGCGEESPKTALEPEVLGDMKYSEDAVPMAPALAGVPYVKEIGYYTDWKRTKPVEGPVPVGKTIYVKMVFSEGMELVVSDGKDARPIVFYRVGKTLTRFRIKGFKVKGVMTSGDLKPMGDTSVFVGKYTVAEEGPFTIAVGKLSTDTQGTPMNAFYVHKEKVVMGAGESDGAAAAQKLSGPLTLTKAAAAAEQKLSGTLTAGNTDAPRVTEVTWYSNRQLTKEVDNMGAGETVYIKVVFSEPMHYVVASDKTARPTLSILGERMRTVPHEASGADFTSLTCKPLGIGTDAFICKYTIPENFEGFFTLRVEGSVSVRGAHIEETSRHIFSVGDVDYFDRLIYEARKRTYIRQAAMLREQGNLKGFNVYLIMFEELGFPPSKSFEEFREILSVYRRVKGADPSSYLSVHETYAKLRLMYPDEPFEKIVERFLEII